MYKIDENTEKIAFSFSSNLKYVDRVIDDSIDFLETNSVKNYSDFKIVLRELLLNAIEHGNKNESTKIVKCEINKVNDTLYKLIIEDEGNGFDFENIKFDVPDDADQYRKRGIPLVNTLADQIEFLEKGNIVEVHFSFFNETNFELSHEGKVKVITPSGNITASVADKLRVLLLEFLEENSSDLIFNFEKVRDMDSISLSLLITFAKMYNRKYPDGQIIVRGAREDIINLFNLTKMTKFYKITE